MPQHPGENYGTASRRVNPDSIENGGLAYSILTSEERHTPETGDVEILNPSEPLDLQIREMEVGIDWRCCGHGAISLVLRLSHRV